MSTVRLAAVAVAAALLAACGQKGPLFLPDESAPVLVTPVQPAPDAAASPVTDPQAERTKPSR